MKNYFFTVGFSLSLAEDMDGQRCRGVLKVRGALLASAQRVWGGEEFTCIDGFIASRTEPHG